MQLRLLDVLLAYVKDQYNEFDYDVLWIKVFDWLKGGSLKNIEVECSELFVRCTELSGEALRANPFGTNLFGFFFFFS